MEDHLFTSRAEQGDKEIKDSTCSALLVNGRWPRFLLLF
jgi:hypothetical protein